MTSFWTPERERHLAELVAANKTALEIAAVLGCARSAVVNKVARGAGRFGRLAVGKPGPVGSFWTPEREKRLADLVAAGMTAREIAAELGCTRSAVLGKVHRDKGRIGGLTGKPRRARTSSQRRAMSAERGAAMEVRKPEAPIAPPAAPDLPATTFLDAITRGTCLWHAGGIDDRVGPDMPVCGAPRADRPRTRFCAYHLSRLHAPRNLA